MGIGRPMQSNTSAMNSGTSFSINRQNEAAANKIPIEVNKSASLKVKNHMASKKYKSISSNNASFLNNINYQSKFNNKGNLTTKNSKKPQ
jgi:hypothetical protein